jgi:hypothetical protein
VSVDVEGLEERLGELRGERAALEAQLTREDLARDVGEWLKIARAHAVGSSRVALAGQATGDDLARVLAEDALADEGLAGRIVKRLEAQGFGQVSDRQRKAQRAKLDSAVAAVEQELRETAKAEAIAAVEAQYAGEAA